MTRTWKSSSWTAALVLAYFSLSASQKGVKLTVFLAEHIWSWKKELVFPWIFYFRKVFLKFLGLEASKVKRNLHGQASKQVNEVWKAIFGAWWCCTLVSELKLPETKNKDTRFSYCSNGRVLTGDSVPKIVKAAFKNGFSKMIVWNNYNRFNGHKNWHEPNVRLKWWFP